MCGDLQRATVQGEIVSWRKIHYTNNPHEKAFTALTHYF
jgi:hypothetical protein